MAYVDYWLGDAGETTASVIVRSDTVGTLALTGCTNDGPHAVDPAVEYGIVRFNVTGLSADTNYSFALQLDAVESASGTLRTMPASGNWSFGFGSCLGPAHVQAYGFQLVNTHNIRAWFALGDTPYCDAGHDADTTFTAYTRWMASLVPGTYASWSSGRLAWDKNYAALQDTPGWKYLTQHVPTYRLPDDHEYGNDWDWTVNAWSTLFSPALASQADIDTCGSYANAAAWSWNKGNPDNADAEVGDWAPSSCADAASNHPPKHYRKRIGNVEFFHIDWYAHMDSDSKADAYRKVCIDNATWNAALGYTYSDPSGAALAKTRLGPYQLNWLLTNLAASTATFKVIVSGKVSYLANATSDNKGLDPSFKTERDYIVAWIKRYATGVLWIAGDVHTASVFNDLSGHCCVNSSPLGQVVFFGKAGTVIYNPGFSSFQTWRATGATGAKATNQNTYGVVQVFDNYLKPAIYSISGELLWSAYLKAGKNYLQPSLDEPGEWA